MPAKSQNNMKGTSPSKSIQRGNDHFPRNYFLPNTGAGPAKEGVGRHHDRFDE